MVNRTRSCRAYPERMRSTTWEEVKQQCAAVEAARLDPETVFKLLSDLPPLDPPSPEPGVARDGASWQPMTAAEYRDQVEANRAAHSAA